MAEDSDDEIAKEARRRVSRHRGPGASSVAPKVEKLLGLRPSSEAQLELLQGEDAALREARAPVPAKALLARLRAKRQLHKQTALH